MLADYNNLKLFFVSLRYEVDLAEDVLAVTLHVTNPGEQAFDFQVRETLI